MCSKLFGGCEVISEGCRENRSEQGKKAKGECTEDDEQLPPFIVMSVPQVRPEEN